MAKYKIESTYLQSPIIIETESINEAFRVFIAYCDYHGIDEDEIECVRDDNNIIVYAKAQLEPEEDDEEGVEFTFAVVK